jgi:hypothetical protein
MDKVITLVAIHATQATILSTSTLAMSDTNQQYSRQSLLANLLAYLHAWCAMAGFGWWYTDTVQGGERYVLSCPALQIAFVVFFRG